MGYSARYHVASLAAVFLALGIGILIGTGLQSVVTDATRNLESSLRSEIDNAQARADSLHHQLDRERAFGQTAYPGLVGGALRGEHVAVVVLGGTGIDASVRSGVDQVASPTAITGARVREFAVVSEPPDVRGLASVLRSRDIGGRPVRKLAGGDALSIVARRAGRAFAQGGPFFRKIQGTLLKQVSGSPLRIDAVIVTRNPSTDLNPAQTDATDRLEAGLLEGLRASGVPVVGVETSTADPSSIGLYSSQGIASVDDIDLESGQVALAYALRGVAGNFGIKSSADQLLPQLVHPRAIRAPAKGSPTGGAPNGGGGGTP